jgi:glycosyltransferase involved in cell wall biosynthesis
MKIGFHLGRIALPSAGGGYTFQYELINGLKKADSRHEIYVYFSSKVDLFSDAGNIKFINIRSKKFFRKISSLSFSEIVKRDGIDMVYFLAGIYEPVNVPFVTIVWDLGHRIIPFFPEVTVSGWTFDEREKYYKSLSKASYIVIGNSEGKRQLEKFYNIESSSIKIIPFATPGWVNTNENTNILDLYNLESGKYLFYPAQFWPHKNHVRILKALEILKSEGYDLKAAFSGADKGNEDYIKDCVGKRRLDDDVKFLGFVSINDMATLYKNAFCLTYASFLGPDNIPPLEAMALQCSVIAAKNTGMEIQLSSAALYFDPTDENDLVKQIKSLYDERLRSSLIKKGKALAEGRTTENYVASLLGIADEFEPIRECWGSEYTHT